MSYPGYPPNNQGYPGQPGAQQPLPSNPTGYPPTSGYPQTSPYPSQPGYAPQPGAYPSQPFGQYPPQQPGQYPPQQPGQYPPQQPGQYAPSQPYPSAYPPAPGYPPQSAGYPSALPGSTPAPGYLPQAAGYPPQAGYPGSQQVPSSYPNVTAGGFGAGHQVPPRAQYPPMTSPAHYQPVGSSQVSKKANPTVRPANPFDARQDAEILRKAMKGFGTDEKAIINVLAHRVNAQRQEIAMHFKTMYGKDLISDLKSELGDKLEDLVVALMTPTYDYLAKELHNAMDGVGTNEETVVEIICTASNSEILNIKSAYHRLFGSDLENDLHGETSGSFRRLLVSLCQGRRSESTAVDVASAQVDAQNLLKAGELQLGTDESTFNMVLCSRSYTQLTQVFLEYHRLVGRDFEDVIKNEFSGDIESGLRAIVKSVRDKSAFFAKRLHESLAGFGTDDRALIRIVATRCEIDMVDIKNAYMSLYGKSLEADIADDTSGDYKKCLTALVVG
ncbi:annexin B9-like isoform X1 [Adelges cooleyi]|uniref:annexin B9-like isoform X1 n=1 Tax=Adelges cooleyi TaxID=133065 RepID=UPI00217F7B2A|nr:annexin B9-like isoform X1 [Adelges cooleyi]XP_050429884.1 annexin B9-like isoform X1 [Adelges cooleyi]